MSKKIKLLIVDDSLIFRSAIKDVLKNDDNIEVVGSVRNGIKAMEFIKSTPPDIVTLDIEMPGMNGLETLEEINAFNKQRSGSPDIGVIMVSSFTKKGASVTIFALELGAFDFVAKPSTGSIEESVELLRKSLTSKIHNFTETLVQAGLKPKERQKLPPTRTAKLKTAPDSAIEAIVIGVSTGGPKALSGMLPLLSEKVDVPIFIVQHMPPLFTLSLAHSLDKKCRHTVVEASDEELVRDNFIYIARGNTHLVLRKDNDDSVFTILNKQAEENGCRPSVDVLFRSTASVYGGNVISIILTGMGTDGTKGLAPLKRAGSRVIVQDEETSVVWGMPGSALSSGNVDDVLPLNQIPGAVQATIKERRQYGIVCK